MQSYFLRQIFFINYLISGRAHNVKVTVDSWVRTESFWLVTVKNPRLLHQEIIFISLLVKTIPQVLHFFENKVEKINILLQKYNIFPKFFYWIFILFIQGLKGSRINSSLLQVDCFFKQIFIDKSCIVEIVVEFFKQKSIKYLQI